MHAARFPRYKRSSAFCRSDNRIRPRTGAILPYISVGRGENKRLHPEGDATACCFFFQRKRKEREYGMVVWISCAVFGLAWALVPPVVALAWRIGAVDVPRDWRRMHRESIPRAGGLAIYGAFLGGCLLLGRPAVPLACALLGGGLLLVVGLVDDMRCLSAGYKLLFQVAVATAAVLGSGVTGGWRVAGAVLWVVVLTNAHNFIDGLDGLFAGCAAIEGILLGVALLLRAIPASPAFFLAAACLGFRLYNRYPARIFAGDCGSGTVGFLLGMQSLSLFRSAWLGGAMLAPLFLFAYPLTDLFTAVLRRLLRGKNPFAADRAHLHHRLSAAGLSHVQCGGVLLSVSAALGSVGVLLSTGRFLLGASCACLGAAFLLVQLRKYVLCFA